MVNTTAQAHPGRTDSSGCHTCRTNCSSWGLSSGEYHCHRAKTTAPQPKEPIKSKYGENGTGYTKPAPEYKSPANNTVKTTPTPEYKSPSVSVPKNTEQPKPVVSQSAQPQPQKGFWQWLFNLFK
ncbi:YHYH domain-containing protein [Patescibacteria group bacterium]|nr:YHYH domain-containing protein [Patescibacteria group bacterium]